ncbi:hypothetical protein GCM10008995_29220 [Halobellus salinus]|uniref:HD domain-containing protein n=1 Tax=Halobellus salinus TaxID=931585 RepID=A0A830EJG2_9EURY|nr:HD domain-containing protein [Halobellus salinus]GGJ17591.1 hypothetical protein GCM10008995_29220 [Halobellus salinus]SMP35397.1 HD domain-containing protein [Halobellus salinus]
MSASSASLDLEEVTRRVPTLRLVDDADVREETARLTAEAPGYFWEVPASTSNYHHPLCRGERGLWVHTLMLSTVIERLGDSYVDLGRLEREDVDLAHAAAVLHDQRKNGDPTAPSETSVSDHDLRMGRVLREESDLPERVAEAVESHMGPWYDGPDPETPLEDLVHTADMIASTETVTAGVQGPLPEELDGLGLEEVDLR